MDNETVMVDGKFLGATESHVSIRTSDGRRVALERGDLFPGTTFVTGLWPGDRFTVVLLRSLAQKLDLIKDAKPTAGSGSFVPRLDGYDLVERDGKERLVFRVSAELTDESLRFAKALTLGGPIAFGRKDET